jgi:hypothetical protein
MAALVAVATQLVMAVLMVVMVLLADMLVVQDKVLPQESLANLVPLFMQVVAVLDTARAVAALVKAAQAVVVLVLKVITEDMLVQLTLEAAVAAVSMAIMDAAAQVVLVSLSFAIKGGNHYG